MATWGSKSARKAAIPLVEFNCIADFAARIKKLPQWGRRPRWRCCGRVAQGPVAGQEAHEGVGGDQRQPSHESPQLSKCQTGR